VEGRGKTEKKENKRNVRPAFRISKTCLRGFFPHRRCGRRGEKGKKKDEKHCCKRTVCQALYNIGPVRGGKENKGGMRGQVTLHLTRTTCQGLVPYNPREKGGPNRKLRSGGWGGCEKKREGGRRKPAGQVPDPAGGGDNINVGSAKEGEGGVKTGAEPSIFNRPRRKKGGGGGKKKGRKGRRETTKRWQLAVQWQNRKCLYMYALATGVSGKGRGGEKRKKGEDRRMTGLGFWDHHV